MEKNDVNETIEISDSDSNGVEILELDNDNEASEESKYQVTEPENEIEWVEESSETEPDLECDVWDDDCVVIRNQTRKNAIIGYHLMTTCLQEHELPPLKRLKVPEIPALNDSLIKEEFKDSFKTNWLSNTDFKLNSVDLLNDPFKFCIIDDFINDTLILNKIREEIYELQLNKRNMDLYEFFQSEDLLNIKEKHLKYLYEFLKDDVRKWIEEITGHELTKTSATCSVYTDTDYLLIHDDREEDRMIAFILYLTDPVPNSSNNLEQKNELWTSEMGGLLELFGKDEKGHPTAPVTSIIPKNNRFVFFKVSNESFHKVSEVLSMDYCRTSINGWFHTSEPILFNSPISENPKTGLFSSERLPPLSIDFSLSDWINPQYLRSNIKIQIQRYIENESEISLTDFFNDEMFQSVCEVLNNDDIMWEKVGPPNKRNYEVISSKVLPNIIEQMLLLFQSKNMFSLLNEYTDLDLNTNIKPNINPSMRFELQRWKPGFYSLFFDYEWDKENELDLIMYLGNPKNLKIVGGQTMYVSMNENIEDALITLHPKGNSLNIVFRDTPRIVKHVSQRSFTEYFYTIVCSYKE